MTAPLRIGIIGLGGFAGSHHQVVRALEAEGACRLVATCDPAPGAFADSLRDWEFERRGVRVETDYRAMLEARGRDLDLVVIPTPIHLHAEMHRACVERGLAVYLEKPPTLDAAELDAMLAVEARARRLTQVGFNFVIETGARSVKRRIAAGEFGRVNEVRLLSLAPRSEEYFKRTPWAGRLQLGGRLVLDSCMGNAQAHYVHNQLFWAGQDALDAWAAVESAEAALYRAHAVENADTFFIRARLAGGVRLRAVLTHACANYCYGEWIHCDRAVIERLPNRDMRIAWRDGREELVSADRRHLLREHHLAYYAYLRGEAPRPVTRLADAVPFVTLCDLALIAAGRIAPVPEPFLERSVSPKDGSHRIAIAGLEDAARAFLDDERWPAPPAAPWAAGGAPSAPAAPADLPRLRETVRRLAADAAPRA